MSSYNLSELFEQVAAKVPRRRGAGDERAAAYVRRAGRAGDPAGQRAARARHRRARTRSGCTCRTAPSTSRACSRRSSCGAVPVNINYRYVERELEHLYNLTDLSAVIVHRQYAPLVERDQAAGARRCGT